MLDLSPQGLHPRLTLKFPQRTVLVERMSATRLEARLVDISDKEYNPGDTYKEIPWPDWHTILPPNYGIDNHGYIMEWVDSCSPEELEQAILKSIPPEVMEKMPDFKGYISMQYGKYTLTDGYRTLILNGSLKNPRLKMEVMQAQVLRADKLFHPDGQPFIKNNLLTLPYNLPHCWVTDQGKAVYDLDSFLCFVDKHVDQVADPFRWTIKKKMTDPGMNLNNMSMRVNGAPLGGLLGGLGNIAPQYEDREELVLEEDEIPWPKF